VLSASNSEGHVVPVKVPHNQPALARLQWIFRRDSCGRRNSSRSWPNPSRGRWNPSRGGWNPSCGRWHWRCGRWNWRRRGWQRRVGGSGVAVGAGGGPHPASARKTITNIPIKSKCRIVFSPF
jgi:hypothetical protein